VIALFQLFVMRKQAAISDRQSAAISNQNTIMEASAWPLTSRRNTFGTA